MKAKLKTILTLFLTFFKIGLFTFGGGYAMIALIEKDVVDKKKWITEKEMLDIIAIAESTPGVISLNSATYVGAKIGGFWGSLAASIGVLLPSIIIISLVGIVLDKFRANNYVKWAFLGIRAAVTALILNAVFKMAKSVEKSVFSYCIFGVSFILAVLSAFDVIPVNIVYIIIASALFGILWGYFMRRKKLKVQPENGVSSPDDKPTDAGSNGGESADAPASGDDNANADTNPSNDCNQASAPTTDEKKEDKE